MFLGDNIYEDGMTGPTTEEKRRIDSQIDIVGATGPKGLFIPGNHDWKGGNSALKAQDGKHLLSSCQVQEISFFYF